MSVRNKPTSGYPEHCICESSRAKVARILKGFNPDQKNMWYQNERTDFTCPCCNDGLRARPAWWARTDDGTPCEPPIHESP